MPILVKITKISMSQNFTLFSKSYEIPERIDNEQMKFLIFYLYRLWRKNITLGRHAIQNYKYLNSLLFGRLTQKGGVHQLQNSHIFNRKELEDTTHINGNGLKMNISLLWVYLKIIGLILLNSSICLGIKNPHINVPKTMFPYA